MRRLLFLPPNPYFCGTRSGVEMIYIWAGLLQSLSALDRVTSDLRTTAGCFDAPDEGTSMDPFALSSSGEILTS